MNGAPLFGATVLSSGRHVVLLCDEDLLFQSQRSSGAGGAAHAQCRQTRPAEARPGAVLSPSTVEFAA